jgi:hypothetical protein
MTRARRKSEATRLVRARAALLDASAEVAAILGGEPDAAHELGAELAGALGDLYRANDEWQQAQVDWYAAGGA